MWTKKPTEIRLETADWSDMLNGDTISGTPALTLTGDLSCTVEHISLANNISTIKITGGEAGESGFIVATINTTGGQRFTPQQPLKVIAASTIAA